MLFRCAPLLHAVVGLVSLHVFKQSLFMLYHACPLTQAWGLWKVRPAGEDLLVEWDPAQLSPLAVLSTAVAVCHLTPTSRLK